MRKVLHRRDGNARGAEWFDDVLRGKLAYGRRDGVARRRAMLAALGVCGKPRIVEKRAKSASVREVGSAGTDTRGHHLAVPTGVGAFGRCYLLLATVT